MGPQAIFPGPIMPQLPFDRNTVVQLGSYLSNLSFNLQRLAPLMTRCGDLMQRESILVNPRDRQLTTDMANTLGLALEEVARSTGSVAHFYRGLHLNQAPGTGSLNIQNYNQEFRPLIDQVGSQVVVNQQQPPHQPSPQETQQVINNNFMNNARNLQERINQQQQQPSSTDQPSSQDPLSSFMQMASPMLNTLLGSTAALDQPISSFSGPEEEEANSQAPILLKLTSQLSITELLALVGGNFGAI